MGHPIYYPVAGDTLPIPFHTFGSDNESITITGLAVTDVEVYKDTSVTQRSSDNGYALIDTDGIDIDSLTGIHGFSIDLSDNSDSGFYEVGPWYTVVVSAITVNSQTVRFIAAQFRIVSATRGLAGTALPDAAADAAGGLPVSDAGALDLDAMNTNISSILTDTGEIGAAGAGLTALATAAELAKVPKSDSNVTWNATALASINAQADLAIADYDPPTKAELDSGLAGLNDLDAAGVRAAVGLASANLDTQLADIPTVSEFNARTLAAADYFDPAADTVANVTTVGSVTTKTGYSLASTGLNLVLIDGVAFPVAMQYVAAATAGKVSGAGTGTEVFVGLDDATNRLTATVDASGNRTAITRNAS